MAGATMKLEKLNSSGGVSLRYSTNVFDSFTIELNTPVSPLPLPEETDDDNVLVKVEGNTTTMTFSWIIKPETSTTVTSDDGTCIPTSVTTVNQQILFFTNIFQPRSIEDKFRLFVDDSADDLSKEGFFTKFTFRRQSNETITYRATVNFIVGDVVTAFEQDAPSAPTAVTAVAGTSSGELDVAWTAPATIGGSAITDYDVLYRKQLQDTWSTASVGSATTSKTLTGLTAGACYQVRVKGVNIYGTGLASNPIVEGTAKA